MMTKKNQYPATALVVDDSTYNTLLTEKYLRRKKWQQPDNRKITAFLPGTVREVLVKKGDAVKAEQTVIRFEAMKMVNNVQSSINGRVKEIYVSAGDRFSKGFVLMELEQETA
ncbi:MAG: acetyl-CoA carboxylase biotin carboxyl carrier protein subunit [Bacteroidales bacterium]|jgi:biotin carboxyl carrier protein|nr:acetyl-CoA carboxylase biotin carboxyl carrier protein subunit [Bacteroidales bacterium]